MKWLSRGKVFTRLYELRNEAYLILTERRHELAANLTNLNWLTKLLYLSCVFEKINILNLSLQGESVDILTAYNKIKTFKKKIQHWVGRVEIGRMDMFSELNDYLEENKFNQKNVKQSIISHLLVIFFNDLISIFPKSLHHNNTTGYYHPSQYQILTIYHQI